MSDTTKDGSNPEDLSPLSELFVSNKDGMNVSAFICNHAEVAPNGLLYINGGGINYVNVNPGFQAPWLTTLAIGAIIEVPWTQTNKEHKVEISLVDGDARAIFLPTQEGSVTPFHAEGSFNIGRAPNIEAGTVQNVAMAFNFHGLPLPRLGTYVFLIEIDREEYVKLVFQVHQA